MNDQEINIRKQSAKRKMKIGLILSFVPPMCSVILLISFSILLNFYWELSESLVLMASVFATAFVGFLTPAGGVLFIFLARLEKQKIKRLLKNNDYSSFSYEKHSDRRDVLI